MNDFPSSVGQRNYSELDIFHIYLDTSTYDEIERDIRNSFEDQLGVLGGTMGLFTGFSILSGVEIIFYLAKLFVTWAGGAENLRENCKAKIVQLSVFCPSRSAH